MTIIKPWGAFQTSLLYFWRSLLTILYPALIFNGPLFGPYKDFNLLNADFQLSGGLLLSGKPSLVLGQLSVCCIGPGMTGWLWEIQLRMMRGLLLTNICTGLWLLSTLWRGPCVYMCDGHYISRDMTLYTCIIRSWHVRLRSVRGQSEGGASSLILSHMELGNK